VDSAVKIIHLIDKIYPSIYSATKEHYDFMKFHLLLRCGLFAIAKQSLYKRGVCDPELDKIINQVQAEMNQLYESDTELRWKLIIMFMEFIQSFRGKMQFRGFSKDQIAEISRKIYKDLNKLDRKSTGSDMFIVFKKHLENYPGINIENLYSIFGKEYVKPSAVFKHPAPKQSARSESSRSGVSQFIPEVQEDSVENLANSFIQSVNFDDAQQEDAQQEDENVFATHHISLQNQNNVVTYHFPDDSSVRSGEIEQDFDNYVLPSQQSSHSDYYVAAEEDGEEDKHQSLLLQFNCLSSYEHLIDLIEDVLITCLKATGDDFGNVLLQCLICFDRIEKHKCDEFHNLLDQWFRTFLEVNTIFKYDRFVRFIESTRGQEECKELFGYLMGESADILNNMFDENKNDVLTRTILYSLYESIYHTTEIRNLSSINGNIRYVVQHVFGINWSEYIM
jgi:hypothetical protein